MLYLQRTVGNRALQRVVAPDDSSEREADRVSADPTLRPMSHSPSVAGLGGQQLDRSTRALMEKRFGHPFDNVRVHIDDDAARSADALGADAFTVGSDIVFAAGKYAPRASEGRALLAHELTHVVQPNAGGAIHRQPSRRKRKRREEKQAERLRQLGARPGDAHRAWKNLSSSERMAVWIQMANRYGEDFAKRFMYYRDHPIDFFAHHYGPGFPEHTREWFEARGFSLWQRSSVNEFWVHPSGQEIMQILDSPRPPEPEPIAVPPAEDLAQIEEFALGLVRDTITRETEVMNDLTQHKQRLEKTNKLDPDYRADYEDYVQSLAAMSQRLIDTEDAVESLRDMLVQGNSPVVSTLDSEAQGLFELKMWAELEASPMSLMFLEPSDLQLQPDEEE